MEKPLILISNDDGIHAPTLDMLIEATMDLGEVLIVAPATNQSSMGRSYPRLADTGIIKQHQKKIIGQNIKVYSVTASPSLTVDHAIDEIASRKPDLCLTGINPGENIGSTMTGSGTVMAAIEASSYNIPAVAFSAIDPTEQKKDTYLFWCQKITQKVLDQGLPHEVSALSVNFPENVTPKTKVDYTRLSRQVYFENIVDRSRDWGKPHHIEVQKKYDPSSLEKDSDIFALIEKKHISVSSVTWDITAPVSFEDMAYKYNF